jgi:hypothetical protein
VVGNAGFLGAVVIILLAKSVTIRTGLSMSFITEFYVLTGTFEEVLKSAPRGNINLFGLREKLSFEFMRNSTELTKSSCLFIKDSGQESALV